MLESTFPASQKERFELLLTATVRFQERFVDSGFKTAAALTVFLGWLLTAESAQAFIKKAPTPLWTVCLIVGAVGTTVILLTFFQAKREAAVLFAKLCGVGYMEPAYVEQYRLKPRLYWSVVLLNGVICALLLGGMVVTRATP
jgi:predicted permease